MSDSERFNARTVVDSETGCINWTGHLLPGGYGIISIKSIPTYVHRYTYENEFGPIPKGLQIDHLCRNRACVNPKHMRAITQYENIMCGESLFAKNAKKTHCPRGHEYSEENTSWYKRLEKYGGNKQRKCKACAREWAKERRQKEGAREEICQSM